MDLGRIAQKKGIRNDSKSNLFFLQSSDVGNYINNDDVDNFHL